MTWSWPEGKHGEGGSAGDPMGSANGSAGVQVAWQRLSAPGRRGLAHRRIVPNYLAEDIENIRFFLLVKIRSLLPLPPFNYHWAKGDSCRPTVGEIIGVGPPHLCTSLRVFSALTPAHSTLSAYLPWMKAAPANTQPDTSSTNSTGLSSGLVWREALSSSS